MQFSATAESEPEGDWFKVYLTGNVGRDAVVTALYRDVDEERVAAKTFVFEKLPGRSTQQVVQHHRGTSSKASNVHSRLFLVFDSDDVEERGALLVGLGKYHGFDDAVRLLPDDANMSICSLSIGNDDWHTLREDVPDERTAIAPIDWFALYNLLPDGHESRFADAAVAMNLGIQELSLSEPADGLDLDDVAKVYRALRPQVRDVGCICDEHAAYAGDNDLDTDRFAVIDNNYETQGALICQLQPRRDSFRCEGEAAGEILRWIYINFMTWDEAKEFAGRQ